jgi:protein Mpv17
VGWYKVLERYVVIKKSANLQMVARVALDQLAFAPVGIATFFSAMTVMEGGNIKEKLENNWWNALKANWNIWPAVQLVNFRFVPLDMRIVVVNIISVGK